MLDRQAPLPSPATADAGARLLVWIWLGFCVAFSAYLLIARPHWVRALRPWLQAHVEPLVVGGGAPVGMVVLAILLTVTFMLAIAVHELGHVVAGMGAGFTFNSIRVGRLQFTRPFRFSFYRGRGTGSGGWAEMVLNRSDRLVPRAVAMLLGGPAVNLLSVAALTLVPHRLTTFAACFGFTSLVLGVVNLLPFRSRAVHSDGARILMLLQGRGRGDRWLALIQLSAQIQEGALPESLSPVFLAKATAVRDASPDTVSAYALAFSSAFHRHADDEAAHALETSLRYSAYAAPILRQALMCDAAVFLARRRRRVDLAEQWLEAMPKRTELPWLRARGEAALLEARGDVPGALAKLEEVERIAGGESNEVRRRMVVRLIQRWRDELRALVPASAAAFSGGD